MAPAAVRERSGPRSESRLLELPDAIEVRITGRIRPDHPTILLLHHGLGSASSWRDFPARLSSATGLSVVAYSRRGYGRSAPVAQTPWPPDFMEREAAGDLPRLLERLEIRRPLLVGHSDGASIALIYAASELEPAPVGLVLMAPHLFVEQITVDGAQAAERAFRRGSLRDALARHHRDPAAAFRGWHEVWTSEAFRDWDIEPRLATVRCPLLAIQGLEDEYGTLAQVEPLSSGVAQPVEMLLLAECGHAPERERPAEVGEAIEAFVAEATGHGRESHSEHVYHVVPADRLMRSLDPASYRPPSLRSEGFVHACRSPATALAVANDLFPESAPLVLRIRTEALAAELRMEPPAPPPGRRTHRRLVTRFPHVYGPIERRAISSVGALTPTRVGYAWPASMRPPASATSRN